MDEEEEEEARRAQRKLVLEEEAEHIQEVSFHSLVEDPQGPQLSGRDPRSSPSSVEQNKEALMGESQPFTALTEKRRPRTRERIAQGHSDRSQSFSQMASHQDDRSP